jgi:hypothetical protein
MMEFGFFLAPIEMESFFEKRLFFVGKKKRPKEALFMPNKKRSLKKTWSGKRDWLQKLLS